MVPPTFPSPYCLGTLVQYQSLETRQCNVVRCMNTRHRRISGDLSMKCKGSRVSYARIDARKLIYSKGRLFEVLRFYFMLVGEVNLTWQTLSIISHVKILDFPPKAPLTYSMLPSGVFRLLCFIIISLSRMNDC